MWFSRQRSKSSRPDDVTFSKHDVMRPQLANGCVLARPQNSFERLSVWFAFSLYPSKTPPCALWFVPEMSPSASHACGMPVK